MAKLYAAYIARAWQTLRGKKVFELSTPFRIVIQIHSFCLVRYYADLTLVVFSSYVKKSKRTRLLFEKDNWFRFSSVQLHAFECMTQSTNFHFLVIELNW